MGSNYNSKMLKILFFLTGPLNLKINQKNNILKLIFSHNFRPKSAFLGPVTGPSRPVLNFNLNIMSPYVTNKYFSNFQVDSSTRLKVVMIYSKKYEKNEFFEIFNSIFSSLYLIDTEMLHYLLYYIKVPFCELFRSIFKISKHLLVDIGSKMWPRRKKFNFRPQLVF